MRSRRRKLALAFLVVALSVTGAQAQDDDIAKQLNNPVANLVSFPIQSNFDFNVGPSDGFRNTTNIQPVVPMKLNEDWNLISRTIVPIVYQNDVFGKSGSQFGFSDIAQSFFFSPEKVPKTALGNFIWGVGPIIELPTSTHRLLGPSAFGLGPTGVALIQDGPWTYGALVNHVWGLAYRRSNTPDVNSTFVQPFISYTTKSAWTFSVNSELTYNWTAKQWSGPINFAVSKLLRIGDQAAQLQGRLRWWAVDTATSPRGVGFTVNLTFVFPRK